MLLLSDADAGFKQELFVLSTLPEAYVGLCLPPVLGLECQHVSSQPPPPPLIYALDASNALVCIMGGCFLAPVDIWGANPSVILGAQMDVQQTDH
jgi:hypothetical protein